MQKPVNFNSRNINRETFYDDYRITVFQYFLYLIFFRRAEGLLLCQVVMYQLDYMVFLLTHTYFLT